MFQFIFEILLFSSFIFFFFYIPGAFIFSSLRIQISSLSGLFLFAVIGLLQFTLLSYMFSWIHLFLLIYPYTLFIDFLYFKKNTVRSKINIERNHIHSFIIIASLAILFSLTKLIPGIYNNNYFALGDDVVHLAYIREMIVHFPPQNPGFAGVNLLGYHFFYDFLIAKTSLATSLSIESLYFHLYPLLVSLLWAYGVYTLTVEWTKKKMAGIFATFLSLFGGSFGFIIWLQGHREISLDSVFGINQPASSLLNPPFSISVVILIAILLLIFLYYQKKNKSILILLALSVGLISMFKVYAGMIAIGGFCIFILIEIFRKNFFVIIPALISLILFLGTFGVFVGKGQSLFFHPLWEPHKVLVDNLPWYGYDEKIYTYTRLGVLRGIIETELYGLELYFLGNLGTRFIGILLAFFLLFKTKKLFSPFAIILLIMIGISILIPLFFIQSGKVFEIIQLAWYYPILCSLPAAIGFTWIIKSVRIKFVQILLFVILLATTIPSAYQHFLTSVIPLYSYKDSLNSPYYKAMDYFKTHDIYDATVLEVPPKNKNLSNLNEWYLKTSTHITAYGNKRTYLNWETIPFQNLDIEKRLKVVKKVQGINEFNQQDVLAVLRKERISYLYSTYPLAIVEGTSIKNVYANGGYFIYKLQK